MMNQKGIKTKPRIFTERPHLRNPSITVLMKMGVDGHFDKSHFEATLHTLKNVHPLLHSSIFIDSNGEAFYQEGSVRQLELCCIERKHQNQWLEVAESENKKSFDCEKGSLIRFFVFYYDRGFDILVVAQHLLGDGDAIARLLRDVVYVYAGNNLPRQEQKLISNQNDIPHNSKLSFPVKMMIRLLNAMWNRGQRPRFGEAEFQKLFDKYHQLTDIGLSHSTINRVEMSNLYNACKAHGVTINEAIVTAFLGAVQEQDFNDKKKTIGIPINIRKQLSFSTDTCLGNFASAITITGKYDSKKDFWQNAILISKRIRSKLDSPKSQWLVLNTYAAMSPLLIDAMYFAAYGECKDKAAKKAASMFSIDKHTSTAISNLGRLDFNCQVGAYNIRDLVFFAPKAPGSCVVLGIATLNDTMQIGFSFDRKIIDPVAMENSRSKMINLLLA